MTTTTTDELEDDVDQFELAVTIPTSLEEAETIASVLSDADEDHLAEHVKYCVQEAKRKAGYLQPKGKV